MRALAIALAAVLLLSSTCLAQESALKSVACPPGGALGQYDGAAGSFYTSFFRDPDAGSGTVNPHAVVCQVGNPLRVIYVAIDSAKPDATAPDLLRIALDGPKFQNAAVAELKRDGPTNTIAPKTVELRFGDRTVKAMVSGSYYKQAENRYLSLDIGTALEGQCKIGQKSYAVRVIDGNANFEFGDECGYTDGRWRQGDTVVIDTGEGDFKKSVVKGFYGQPLKVGQAWYTVSLAKDGKSLLAEQLKAETGKLKIDQEQWSATLANAETKVPMKLSGGKEAVEVPAGKYLLLTYTVKVAPDKKHPFGGSVLVNDGGGKTITVAAGKTADLVIGPPLVAQIVADKKGDVVTLSLEVKDAGGLAVVLSSGSPTGEPSFTVTDAAGKEVYSGKLSYG